LDSRFYVPRLHREAARGLLAEFSDMSIAEMQARAEFESDKSYFYPTAPMGQRATVEMLGDFQQKMREIAKNHGYPESLSPKDPRRTEFDREVVSHILEVAPLIPAAASVEAVWSFLTLVVVPDVAFWRWPNTRNRDDYERLLGYPRNVFRRLWWRAYTLGSGPGSVSDKIYEDEAVAILERTVIGGNRKVARIIAETHIRRFAGERQRTNIMRDAMKRIRRLHAFISFHSLHEAEIHALVDEAFTAAAISLRQKAGSR
jgi:hypothetical protein